MNRYINCFIKISNFDFIIDKIQIINYRIIKPSNFKNQKTVFFNKTMRLKRMNLLKITGLLLFVLMSIPLNTSNAADNKNNQERGTSTPITKEADHVSLFENSAIKDSNSIKLHDDQLKSVWSNQTSISLDSLQSVLSIAYVQGADVNNLKLVCKNWKLCLGGNNFMKLVKDLLKDSYTVEITDDDLYDTTGSSLRKMKRNHTITNLTFDFEKNDVWNTVWYDNKKKFIEELENKKNLKAFTFKGVFDVSHFFKTRDEIDNIDAENFFLKFPNLVFLKTLEVFHITTELGLWMGGSNRQPLDFNSILRNESLAPKLRVITGALK
ncbi:MAG: hypothetical protein ACOH2E_05035 [Candidatus Paracaedibacter sp.]